jgi:carboxyl-terminal processing protease
MGNGRTMGRNRLSNLARASIPVALMLVTVLAVSSCGSSPPKAYEMPAAADYSNQAWSTAFEHLNAKFSREYAFTEWKDIDWKALYARYKPIIVKAEKNKDAQAYELALREYACSIPDGHISVSGGDPGLSKRLYCGGFGLVVMKLDNGKVVANWVGAGSPASQSGIASGAEILNWGGKPIARALASTSVVLGKHQATDAGIRNQQLSYLTRAPVGETREVTFRNPGESKSTTVDLTAVDDGGESFLKNYPHCVFPPNETVTSVVLKKTLPGNVGYIRILAETDMPAENEGDHTPTLDLFRNAVREFGEAGVSGLVIDIRGNGGGSDQMVTQFMSSFYKKKTFYEYQNYFNFKTGKWEIWVMNESPTPGAPPFIDPGQGLYIEPGEPRFDGPVVAIVNNQCISSGEGVAMGVRNLPNGKVVGFYGTNGSFGMAGDSAKMPGGLTVEWPFGQSLDKDKVVQLDSRDGKGGVLPNSRTPMTLENAIKVAEGQDVELQSALDTIKALKKNQ